MIKTKKLTIGERIKLFRKRAEMSQLDLEIEACLAIGSLTKIEGGVHMPTAKVVQRIIVALKLNKKESAYLYGINFYKNEIKKNQNNPYSTIKSN